ncbi:MAG: tRNA 2-selenouridine(34) synthase MnmH [Bacteroidia bacterium]|nr:tRNA 2-selenouridine(34) synthase MnmH [Bacteroidia bacterium]
MYKIVSIDTYLKYPNASILLDVRSEGEFEQGHILDAISFPILNDEERKLVGTCYKQKGHKKAVILGYELVGPKFKQYIEYAYKNFGDQPIYVHCWRGGLRSKIMSSLLSSAGFEVYQISGGYKEYRKLVLSFLESDFHFSVLGGLTGCGKTEILEELGNRGAQTIDIERLANHKGSAFGGIGMPSQPTQEQFENNRYHHSSKLNLEKNIWIEDESRINGKLQIPDAIYRGIRSGFVYFLDYDFEYRLQHIVEEYGVFDKTILIENTTKLRKRMGDMLNRNAIEALQTGDVKTWAGLVLSHYDKQYYFGFGKRDSGSSKKIEMKGEELYSYLSSIKKA